MWNQVTCAGACVVRDCVRNRLFDDKNLNFTKFGISLRLPELVDLRICDILKLKSLILAQIERWRHA